jgi:arginase
MLSKLRELRRPVRITFDVRAGETAARRSPAKMKAIGLEEVPRVGAPAATQEALACAAVDYRLPGGLTWVEIEEVLSAALAHPKALGMEITIFNPRLDANRNGRSALVDMLTSAFPGK